MRNYSAHIFAFRCWTLLLAHSFSFVRLQLLVIRQIKEATIFQQQQQKDTYGSRPALFSPVRVDFDGAILFLLLLDHILAFLDLSISNRKKYER